MTTTDTSTRNAGPLSADQCMTLSHDGDACRKPEYHPGLHDWQVEATENGVSLTVTPGELHALAEQARQRIRTKLRAPTEEEFDGADFLKSGSLDRLAQELIDSCYELEHLQDLKLAYLWKRTGGKSKGKPTLGKCQKPSGLLAHFSEVDYVITLSADHAREYQLSAYQLEALLFHELNHTCVDEDEETLEKRVATQGHDVEEFRAVLKRYGCWQPDLRAFAETVRQLKLDEAKG